MYQVFQLTVLSLVLLNGLGFEVFVGVLGQEVIVYTPMVILGFECIDSHVGMVELGTFALQDHGHLFFFDLAALQFILKLLDVLTSLAKFSIPAINRLATMLQFLSQLFVPKLQLIELLLVFEPLFGILMEPIHNVLLVINSLIQIVYLFLHGAFSLLELSHKVLLLFEIVPLQALIVTCRRFYYWLGELLDSFSFLCCHLVRILSLLGEVNLTILKDLLVLRCAVVILATILRLLLIINFFLDRNRGLSLSITFQVSILIIILITIIVIISNL